ncbi:hypothetical protein F511_03719 [Dorcoceras hygrometricum]|uniref:Uncharacterized protein n=1 Tax=Dorcoceras hygrometricum TaxID=472368 RepID=A0A2Z7BKL3_9LAMI|nr:hypothetical protein F511_03719 [Dorcoceras hygrometricum]
MRPRHVRRNRAPSCAIVRRRAAHGPRPTHWTAAPPSSTSRDVSRVAVRGTAPPSVQPVRASSATIVPLVRPAHDERRDIARPRRVTSAVGARLRRATCAAGARPRRATCAAGDSGGRRPASKFSIFNLKFRDVRYNKAIFIDQIRKPGSDTTVGIRIMPPSEEAKEQKNMCRETINTIIQNQFYDIHRVFKGIPCWHFCLDPTGIARTPALHALDSSREALSSYTLLGGCSWLERDREVAVHDRVFVRAGFAAGRGVNPAGGAPGDDRMSKVEMMKSLKERRADPEGTSSFLQSKGKGRPLALSFQAKGKGKPLRREERGARNAIMREKPLSLLKQQLLRARPVDH